MQGPGREARGESIRVPADGLTHQELEKLARSYAVVCVRGAGDGVLSLAATGDVRAHLADRLGPDAEGMKDLRGVGVAVELVPCDSIFEADLLFMTMARTLDPGLHDRATRKLNIWWLGTFPDARRAEWVWEQDPRAFEDGMRVVGPFVDKHKVKKHAAHLDSAFELCRYPGELHRAPHGTACDYKDMGRCPAPCDGSEALDTYEDRLREALELNTGDAEEMKRKLGEEMREAAGKGAFERAGAVKERLARFEAFGKRQLAVIGSLAEARYVAVTKTGAEAKDEAAVLMIDQGRWARGERISSKCDGDAFEQMARAMAERIETGLGGSWDLGVLAAVSREVLRPSRGGPALIRLDRLTGPILARAVRSVTRKSREEPSER